jgi:Meckelin (Transmembrane protein 67)
MQTYIERVRLEPRQYVRERGAIARWLGIQPLASGPSWAQRGPAQGQDGAGRAQGASQASSYSDIPVLFKDKWMNFSNFLLCGLDFDFLMLDVCMVTLIDLIAWQDSTLRSRLMLGCLIAYIVDSLLISLRRYSGRRNLASHTLADERFLI